MLHYYVERKLTQLCCIRIMGKSIRAIMDEFARAGFRRSRSREVILRLIRDSKQPVSAQEIRDMLRRSGDTFNKTTIYREIETLQKAWYIKELFLRSDKALYEMAGEHHHHVMCVSCGDVRHIKLQESLDGEEQKIARREGFRVVEHSLEFFGLCQKCA